jgi:hypothetical protein
MWLEFIWSFLVYGVNATIFAAALLCIYESQRPYQNPLSDREKKEMHATITRLSLIAGGVVGLFFASCKIWSHPN